MRMTFGRASFAGVCVDLTGGLGNQLFGFAAGWTQAHRLGVPLGLRHRRQPGETPRSFALNWLLDSPQVQLCEAPPRKAFRERSFAYDQRINQLQAGTRLVGYFQSWRYAEPTAPQLRQYLLEHGLDQHRIDRKPIPQTFIAVHARRGDYLGARQLAFHGVCAVDYYVDSALELRSRLGELPIMVFSDDDAFGEQLVALIPDSYLADTSGAAPEQVLSLMSQAQGLVMSNSSFSWWAGWLAGDSATVIAPTPWFTDLRMPTADLLPPTWLIRSRGDSDRG